MHEKKPAKINEQQRGSHINYFIYDNLFSVASCRGSKKVGGAKSCNLPTYSYKFPTEFRETATEEMMGAQNFMLTPKCTKNVFKSFFGFVS